MKLQNRLYVACGIFCVIATQVRAAEIIVEPRFGVDMPTAGILHRGQYAITTQVFRDGGLMAGVSVGLFDRMMFGVSFGGDGIIGAANVAWQKSPGISVKYRVFDETIIPAFVIGFDSQGNEGYIAAADRFTIKSPGFYVAASKNYSLLGYLSFHGCLNYSLENSDTKIPDLTVSAEKSIGGDIAVTAEYNFGLNDYNTMPQFGKNRGYFNIGLRWLIGGGFTIEADAKNLLANQDGVPAGSRVVRMDYVQSFR